MTSEYSDVSEEATEAAMELLPESIATLALEPEKEKNSNENTKFMFGEPIEFGPAATEHNITESPEDAGHLKYNGIDFYDGTPRCLVMQRPDCEAPREGNYIST